MLTSVILEQFGNFTGSTPAALGIQPEGCNAMLCDAR